MILGLTSFINMCWYSANRIWVCLASLESDRLLYTKGCLNRWFEHDPPKLKSKSNKDKSDYFDWLCTHVPFSYFLKGFYKANDIIIIALIVHSCISSDDDCYQDINQTLARESMSSSLRGLGNHTKQEPLIGAISGYRIRVSDHVVNSIFTFVNIADCT